MAIPTAGLMPLTALKGELEYAAKQKLSKKNEKRLESLKDTRDTQLSANRSAAAKKGWITRRGRKAGKSEAEIAKEKDKIFTYKLGIVDNEMNMLLGDDFFVTINDRFNEPYRMKASQLMKDDAPLKVMKKYERAVKKELRRVDDELGPDSKQAVVLEKLLNKVQHNKSIIEKQFRQGLSEEEVADEFEEYPMNIDIAGDVLELNI